MSRFGDNYDDQVENEYDDDTESSAEDAEVSDDLSADDPLRAMTADDTLTADALPAEVTDEVIRFYSPLVWKLALTKTRSTHDAQDIFQDVFVKLVMNEKPFESEEHRKAWLIRVTLNRCRSHYRSHWWRRILPLEEAAHAAVLDEYDPELTDALALLPAKYRAVIHLHYFENYDTSEIAALTGQQSSTVRSQLTRARQILKAHLKGGYDA